VVDNCRAEREACLWKGAVSPKHRVAGWKELSCRALVAGALDARHGEAEDWYRATEMPRCWILA